MARVNQRYTKRLRERERERASNSHWELHRKDKGDRKKKIENDG